MTQKNEQNDMPARDATQGQSTEELLDRIGQLTRALHNSMRELGLDKEVEKAAEAIPDARDRLKYIATMTEQAANKTLNSVDQAQPLQDDLKDKSEQLDQRWQRWFDAPMELSEARELVDQTRQYLQWVPQMTAQTNALLLDIMMAQDFQDLTGQVVKKMTEVIHDIEHQLVEVLLDNVTQEQMQRLVEEKRTADTSLLNGPQVSVKENEEDVVKGQDDVDDLLDSLGF